MMPCPENNKMSVKATLSPASCRGFSLVELVVTMAIFSILMAGIFQAYIAQMKSTSREYNIAESDIDRQIGQGIINRDIFMAGYGLADDYTAAGTFAPWALQSTDGGSGAADTLTLAGTALSMNSQQAQHWSYIANVDGDTIHFGPKIWVDSASNDDFRENLHPLDMVILIEPASKRLITNGPPNNEWLFKYIDEDNDPATVDDKRLNATAGGDLSGVPNQAIIYSLYKYDSSVTEATQPYYTVQYRLSAEDGAECAPGVKNLLRHEWRTLIPPSAGARPLISCVADFQVAIGLDTDNNREIDLWQDGGVSTDTNYNPARLNRSLRQVRVYALTQIGDRDNLYTYPSDTIYVGDEDLGTGRSITLTDAQRHYRWRVIRFVAVPRNIR